MSKYQLLPPLSEAELAALRDDIAAVGIRVPIDVDENGEVLDGHHRKAVALMLGVECPERVVRGLEEFEKVDYALTVNLARRHLDREARRDLVKKSLLRDAGLADREHARRCGVHHDTVGRVRAELEKLGKLEPQVKRTGGDGKERQLADSASSQKPAQDPTNEESDPVVPVASSSALPEDSGTAPGSAPAEQEEPRDGSPPADERPQAETGVTQPAAAPQPVEDEQSKTHRELRERSSQRFCDGIVTLTRGIAQRGPEAWLDQIYLSGAYKVGDMPGVAKCFTPDSLRELARTIYTLADHLDDTGRELP
jgi:hypothetical protein